jgi:tRNA (cmo5U34)-methyltransferase
MLIQLQSKYASRKTQIELIRGSYLELSLGTTRFDYVISVMTLHHLLPQKKTCLYKKINRALKPGGKYIEADYVVSKGKEVHLLALYQEKADAGYLDGSYHLDIPMSVEMIKALLFEAGFSNTEIVWQLGESAVLKAYD